MDVSQNLIYSVNHCVAFLLHTVVYVMVAGAHYFCAYLDSGSSFLSRLSADPDPAHLSGVRLFCERPPLCF